MATLVGHAVKISWLGAEHTYVTSSDGFVWPCWGRSSGGRNICSGTGSSAQANCISMPKSTAGIIYGVTGVCHQTANRILWPCRKIVSGAKGYWASSLAYGAYGTDTVAWLARKAACSLTTGDRSAKVATVSVPKGRRKAPSQEAGEKEYIARVMAIYEEEATKSHALHLAEKGKKSIDLLASELDLTLDYRLGKSKASNIHVDMKTLQQKLLTQIEGFEKDLYMDEITPLEYANSVNKAFDDSLKRSVKILGEENYAKLFGITVDQPMLLIDPKIMVKVNK